MRILVPSDDAQNSSKIRPQNTDGKFYLDQEKQHRVDELRMDPRLTLMPYTSTIFTIVSKASGARLTQVLHNPVQVDLIFELAEWLIVTTDYDGRWDLYRAKHDATGASGWRTINLPIASSANFSVAPDRDALMIADGTCFVVEE